MLVQTTISTKKGERIKRSDWVKDKYRFLYAWAQLNCTAPTLVCTAAIISLFHLANFQTILTSHSHFLAWIR